MQEAKSMICPLFIKLWYFWIFIFILIDYFLNNCFKIVIFGWSTKKYLLKTKKAFIKIHAFSSLCVCVLRLLSYVQLFVTLWTVAHQAPLSMEFSSQECRSGLPYFAPGDLPKPGIEPASLGSPELAGGFFTTSTTGKHFLAYWNKFFFHKYTHSYLQTSAILKCLHTHEPLTHSFLFLNLQDFGQAVFSFYNILNTSIFE